MLRLSKWVCPQEREGRRGVSISGWWCEGTYTVSLTTLMYTVPAAGCWFPEHVE